MKAFIVVLLTSSAIVCGCGKDVHHYTPSDRPNSNVIRDTSAEKWDSLPRLERIAREYARQQKLSFDFANTHAETHVYTENDIAFIYFFHGMHEPVLTVEIDSKGKVIEADIAIQMEPPRPELESPVKKQ